MIGLFKDQQLNSFCLNKEARQYHLVSRYIGLSEEEYCSLTSAQAQDARLEKAIEACNQLKNVPYFIKAVLKKMLRWESEERPSFIKLKLIFEDEKGNLFDNRNEQEYVDALIENVMKKDEKELMDQIHEEQYEKDSDDEDVFSDDDDDLQFTQMDP